MIGLLIFLSCHLWGLDKLVLEDWSPVDSVIAATSKDGLYLSDQVIQQYLDDQLLCHDEIQHKVFPYHCLLHAHTESLANKDPFWLNKMMDLCVRRASQIQDIQHVDRILTKIPGDSLCFKALQERRVDLAYIGSP